MGQHHDTTKRMTLTTSLALFFRDHPGKWIDGRRLSKIAGYAAWRTRISDLRKSPFRMTIENRQRRVKTADGAFVISEYRFVPVTAHASVEATR